jgi:Ni,Fe-hydrogenase I small subunit
LFESGTPAAKASAGVAIRTKGACPAGNKRIIHKIVGALITREKLQKDKGMRNGFDFYYYLDRINRISRNFFACGEGPCGRRPHYPNDPVNPVQLFSL